MGSVGAWFRAGAVVAVARAALAAGARLPAGRGERRELAERRVAALLRRMLGMDVQLGGHEPDPAAGPYVVVALHESLVDPIVVAALPLALRWVVRDEILEWSDVGPYLRGSQQVAIRPEDGAPAYRLLLEGAREVLEAGESIVMFPQGSVLGIETRFAGGPIRVAEVLGYPLLPVVVTGTHLVWEHPFRPTLRFGQEVGMHVLEPVPPAELTDSGHEEVRRRLQREMKALALSGALPAPRRYDPERDGYWDGYAYEIDPAFPAVAALVTAHRAGSPGRA